MRTDRRNFLPIAFFLAAIFLFAGPEARADYCVDSAGDAVPAVTAHCAAVCDGTNDCTLRDAITAANASPGTDDAIVFQIPGAGVHTISLVDEFPHVTDTVLIDGLTQPGSSPNTQVDSDNAVLLIEIKGAGGPFFGGLQLSV